MAMTREQLLQAFGALANTQALRQQAEQKKVAPQVSKPVVKPVWNESKVPVTPQLQQRNLEIANKFVSTTPGAFAYGVGRGISMPVTAAAKLMGYQESPEEAAVRTLAESKRLTSQMDASKGMGQPNIIQGRSIAPEMVGKVVGSILPFSKAEAAAGALFPQIAGAGIKNTAIRGAISGGALQGLEEAGQGKRGMELAGSVALGTALGAGADIGLGYLGKAIRNIKAGQKVSEAVAEIAQKAPESRATIQQELGLPEGSTWADIERQIEAEAKRAELDKQVERYYQSLEERTVPPVKEQKAPFTGTEQYGVPSGKTYDQFEYEQEQAQLADEYMKLLEEGVSAGEAAKRVYPGRPFSGTEQYGVPEGMDYATYQKKLDEEAAVNAYYKMLEENPEAITTPEQPSRVPSLYPRTPDRTTNRVSDVGIPQGIVPKTPFLAQKPKGPMIPLKSPQAPDIERELFPPVMRQPTPVQPRIPQTQPVTPTLNKIAPQVNTAPVAPKLSELNVDNGPSLTVSNLAPKIEPATDAAKTISDVVVRGPKYKDVGVLERWTTDVYRNFEKVFGKDYDTVKKAVLDPFDNAKKARVQDETNLANSLKADIVDSLGIKKGSKESALVQRYGEKNIDYNGLVKEVGQEKADKIVKANDWFRSQYDKLIDEINAPRIAQGKAEIPKREDYYRHYMEMADTFSGIRNIFESPSMISPKLEGISEYTKPGEKWASFKQKRTGNGKFTEDAVGGFIDYIKAGTYAKHIDPEIQKFRDLRTQLANSTEGSKNINQFIEYLDEYANSLAGKTNMLDRTAQKFIGRKGLSILNAINSRVKSNAVLGNAASALAQVANIPQGIAFVKNPEQLAKGANGVIGSISGAGDKALYNQSGFLSERYADNFSQFNTKWFEQPKKAAAWMLQVFDELGTKFIWSSAYRKGIADGVEDAVKYADDVARKMVAGRGIGETPIAQQSKLFQMIAPFTLEVGNQWKVQKDFLKNSDVTGLMVLYAGNFLLNKALEEVRGSGVSFDPIAAILEGSQQEGTFADKLVSTGGSLAGEVLSNVPLGSSLGAVYPEYGFNIGEFKAPTRAELYGKNDPTRYGISLPIVKAVQDPLKNVVLPFGGAQVSKTVKGLQSQGIIPQVVSKGKGETERIKIPASVSASGRIRTATEKTPAKTAQAVLFGGYASPEVRKFFEEKKTAYGTEQTAKLVELKQQYGYDLNKLDKALSVARGFNTKAERVNALLQNGFNQTDANEIASVFWGYKK